MTQENQLISGMSLIWARFRQRIAPPVFEGDEQKTLTAQVLHAVILFTVIVWSLTFFAMPFTKKPLVGVLIVSGLVIIGIGELLALRAGHVHFVANSFLVFLWVAVTLLVMFSGGIVNPETAGFIVVIFVAGMFVGIRTALVFAGLSVLSVGVIYIAERLGVPMFFPIEPFSGMVITITNIAMLTGILGYTLSRMNQAMERARKYAQEIEEERASLEMRVVERTQHADHARQEAEAIKAALETQLWQISEQARLSDILRGEQDISTLSTNVIQRLCQSLDVPIGALFVQQEGVYKLTGSYAYQRRKSPGLRFRPGEGLVGQAALEKQMLVLEHVPPGYMAVHMGAFQAESAQVVAIPFLYNDEALGVVELGSLRGFDARQLEFLQRVIESVGVAFGTARARSQVNDLLYQTRLQARELQQREDELKSANLELQRQAEDLRTSQERLRANQTSLEMANAELEEKTDVLQQQRTLLDQQYRDLRATQEELLEKTEQLIQANQYKSEFLANMSHELRTPLNSLLILSRMLANNEGGNLTEEQVRSAEVIYDSGADLLALINDILDLSKVEAGRMEFYIQPTPLSELVEALKAQFKPIAEKKELPFYISLDSGLPQQIDTDPMRLLQVLKNLLSNAFKFTQQGSISLVVTRPQPSPGLAQSGLDESNAIAIQVVDTGVGIPPDKQEMIFEAFRQVESGTSRGYDGTGLGLAIAREMIAHLGGFIELESTPGVGSTFTVIHPIIQRSSRLVETDGVPEAQTASKKERRVASRLGGTSPLELVASPDAVTHPPGGDIEFPQGARLILIVEDDPNFAEVLQKSAQKRGFHCLVAGTGELGLEMASRYPLQAILLDLDLPGISGWEVLDALKNDPTSQHIPVHVISAEEESMDAYQRGAIGFMTKPVSIETLNRVFQSMGDFIDGRVKSLLVVDGDEGARQNVIQLLSDEDVEITGTGLGEIALELLHTHRFDCMILDLSLLDMSGFDLLERLHGEEHISRCPVIVYTDRELTEEENHQLMRFTNSVIIKGAKSQERLLDETALFLHHVVAEMPADKQMIIRELYRSEDALRGKRILIVDDDMRNSFALSKLLGEKGVRVEIAPGGEKALELLEKNPDIDLVLMDVMMPGMDGLETTRRIRQMPQYGNLPILALTAKAMKGDREKCIDAGANDYLSKPFDPGRLFTMLRMWLYERG